MSIIKDIGNFITGADDKKLAAAEGRKADQSDAKARGFRDTRIQLNADRRGAMEQVQADMQDKYDTIYDPMERELADEAANGIDVDNEAEMARGNFIENFDAAQEAGARNQMTQGIQPGSPQALRMAREVAFDRARGSAAVQTNARTEADDRAFLRKNAFFNANGQGMQDRLAAGISDIYGTDFDAQGMFAAEYDQDTAKHEGLQAQHSENAGAFTNLVGRVAGGAMGLAAGPTGAAFMGGVMDKWNQPQNQGAAGITGVPTSTTASAIAPDPSALNGPF